jgi:hypothetical protein
VLRSAALPRTCREGLAGWGDEIVSRPIARRAFRWICRTLAARGEIACPGEAWGYQRRREPVRSDGTPVRDPDVAERSALLVTRGRPLGLLND